MSQLPEPGAGAPARNGRRRLLRAVTTTSAGGSAFMIGLCALSLHAEGAIAGLVVLVLALGIAGILGIKALERRSFLAGAIASVVLCCTTMAAAVPLVTSRHPWRRGYSESSVIGDLRTLTTAQALYRESDKDRSGGQDYATTLEALGEAGLIDSRLASGTKYRYLFRIVQADCVAWSATADPGPIPALTTWDLLFPPATTRSARHFFVDESGVIRYSTTGTATAQSAATGT